VREGGIGDTNFLPSFCRTRLGLGFLKKKVSGRRGIGDTNFFFSICRTRLELIGGDYFLK